MTPNNTDTLITDLENTRSSDTNAYPNIKSVITLFFVSIAFMFLVAIPVGVISIGIPKSGPNASLLRSLLNSIAYVASLFVIINYAVKRSKKQRNSAFNINFNKIQGWLIPVIIIGTLALIIPLSDVSDWIPMPESTRKFFEEVFTRDIFSIVTATIAAPIMEEILCRGIVLKGLLKNYAPLKAILISALFFSLIHLNPWQSIPAFFGGLYIGWVYYKTQSVIPGMIIHFTINATGTLILFLPGKQKDFPHNLGMSYHLTALQLSILVFSVICMVIRKKAIAIPKRLFNDNTPAQTIQPNL